MNSFYNTTAEPDPKLFEVKARTQEQIVLELFRKHPDLTASECHKLYPDFRVPLTSIRRSITNLATVVFRNGQTGQLFKEIQTEKVFVYPMCAVVTEAKLQKTNVKRIGIYGRPEYAYKIINRL
jgi:hypothetical protein